MDDGRNGVGMEAGSVGNHSACFVDGSGAGSVFMSNLKRAGPRWRLPVLLFLSQAARGGGEARSDGRGERTREGEAESEWEDGSKGGEGRGC